MFKAFKNFDQDLFMKPKNQHENSKKNNNLLFVHIESSQMHDRSTYWDFLGLSRISRVGPSTNIVCWDIFNNYSFPKLNEWNTETNVKDKNI